MAEPTADPRGHVVQFYDRDDELADSVGNGFGEALRAGSAVILVATAAHRAALDGWLEAAGADVSAARNRGGVTIFAVVVHRGALVWPVQGGLLAAPDRDVSQRAGQAAAGPFS